MTNRSSKTDLSAEDYRRLEARGIGREEAGRQLSHLRDPPPPVRLEDPCTRGNGIARLEESLQPALRRRFGQAVEDGRVLKLVPASGAATRMFQDLEGGDEEKIEALLRDLEHLPFAARVAAAPDPAGQGGGESLPITRETLRRALLDEDGLDFGRKPKGLIPFHRYGDQERTAFEEHLVEAGTSLCGGDGRCSLHFTVAEGQEQAFRSELERARPHLERRLACRFEVGFSHQSPETDTLAIEPGGVPFRDRAGDLLLRPGGHGALIRNLARLAREETADLILIKNIDNVARQERHPSITAWEAALGGFLLDVQERIFALVESLEKASAEGLSAALVEAGSFLPGILRPGAAQLAGESSDERRNRLLDRLDRPLRVCGMVPNQGEPGGGPFWVRGSAGDVTPQIVELSQIDLSVDRQRELASRATHFNPVDLICAVRDRHGRPYDLESYVDPSTVFIAEKTHEGRPLQALERPGLWNGAMAGWNTLFVEIPAETFVPVKTVFDLLRPGHREATDPLE